MSFSARGQARVEIDQGFIPAEGGRQGCGEQRAAQTSAAAGDMSLSLMLSAIVVVGCEPGQRCGFLAVDAAEFRHADDECDCGALAEAGNAQHQIETMGEIVVSAQRCDNAQEFGGPSFNFSRAMSAIDHATRRRITDMFEADLEASNVLLDLLNEGQVLRQLRQATIRLDTRLIDRRRSAAMRTASSLSFLARRRCTRA